MQTERVHVSKLRANAENPRKLRDERFEALQRSLKDFPRMLELRPIVATRDGTVLGGNMRLRAAVALGWTDVPVTWADDLSDEQRREFVVKDNLPFGEWDWDELANGWDAGLLEQWGMEEVGKLAPKEAPDEDDVEIRDEPVSKLGDLYQLGDHVLLVGDATNGANTARLAQSGSVDLLLTDPPYNVAYEGSAGKIENDDMEDGAFLDFLTMSFSNAAVAMKPGASFYVFHADSEGLNFRQAVKDSGLDVRQCLVWVKDALVLGRQDYQWKHEPVLYGWKPGASHTWLSDRSQTTVLEFDRPRKSADHPTMKPVEMLAYLVANSCPVGGTVLDPFSGSGSTLVACEQTGRRCLAMELDPRYADAVVRRFHALNPSAPISRNGQPFDLEQP